MKNCPRCSRYLPTDQFVDSSGEQNARGRYCMDCHKERVVESKNTAMDNEQKNIRKLRIVYGDYWRHYALPEYFDTSLRNERAFCPYCGTDFANVVPEKFTGRSVHLDHMDPLELGGEHSVRNVVYCCGPCNISKGKRPFSKWLNMLDDVCRDLSRNIYKEKHGHDPEDFVEGCNYGRGTRDLEFATEQSEEELRRLFPKPKADGPPTNQPFVIGLDEELEFIIGKPLKVKRRQARKIF